MVEMNNAATTFTTPSDREIVMERVFDAPRELVFQVCTNPESIPHWWGPGYLTTTVDKMDVRPGGVWRYVQRDADGNEFAFNGVYLEIVPPEKVVNTFEFEGLPGHIVTETVRFEDLGGKTKMTTTSVFQTVEDRDGMLESGMKEGAIETYNRLAEYLQTML